MGKGRLFLIYKLISYFLDLYEVGDKWELLKLRSPFMQRLMQMTITGENLKQACNIQTPQMQGCLKQARIRPLWGWQ